MYNQIEREFERLKSQDKDERYQAYQNILEATEEKVDWAYKIWDQLLEDLTNKDNHQRSRAAQYLANLAKSDPEQRMLKDFPKVWQVTYDEKFVTARHSLQAIWKIGLAGQEQEEIVMKHLVNRFKNSITEKNYTLIRSDIIQNIRNLYDHRHDEKIKETAMELIETVDVEKYKKKYLGIWK